MSDEAVQLLKINEVSALTRMSRSWVFARVKAGEFPAPIKISARSIAWPASDIEKWLVTRPRAFRS